MSSPASTRVVAVVGNPRVPSRTSSVAAQMATVIAAESDTRWDLIELGALPDLATGGPATTAAVKSVLGSEVVVVATPTYKASFSGLLKTFLDQFGAGVLEDLPVVALQLVGSPAHSLACDLHLRPVLIEIGASCPTRSLVLTEADLDQVEARIRTWAATQLPLLWAVAGARRTRDTQRHTEHAP